MNRYLYTDSETVYYILCSFNKLKLDKKEVNLLSKIGFCNCCLKILFDKTISDKELEYINSKDWDDFLDKYPMRLNQCNCTRCHCGLNKILDIQYDLFDVEEKNPICFLSCSKCDKLTIPIVDKVEKVETINKYKRNNSEVENFSFNKNKKSYQGELLIKSKEKNTMHCMNPLDSINNQLICNY